MNIVTIILFGLLIVFVLREPYLGIVATVASLPVIELLPPIPYATSAVSLLGGITLISYFIHRIGRRRNSSSPFLKALLWGALFIVWLFFSNPSAALLPSIIDGRIWVFTFVQLWIMAWLASQLLDTPNKHSVLMGVFAAATVLSSVYSIQQGYIGATFSDSLRSTGLAGGANSAARYFVVGIIFLYYLRMGVKSPFLRLVLLLCMGVVFFGTLYTVSRSGLLLLMCAFGMIMLQGWGEKRQTQAIFVFLLALLATWLFADNVLAILGSILQAIQQGDNTVGVRYGLWQAGWRMWLAHPIQGVGIGQFNVLLRSFGWDLLPARYLHLHAHNMYVQVLAEIGSVGLFLFLGLLGSTMHSLRQTAQAYQDIALTSLAKAWQIILVILFLGGITKSDHYDKLLWLGIGAGLSLLNWRHIESEAAQENGKI